MQDRTDQSESNRGSSNWRDFLIIILLLIAALLIVVGIKKAQRNLIDYLKTKKQTLEELLGNIEKAQRDKKKLLFYKQTANVLLRSLTVGTLVSVNILYLKFFFVDAKLPEILGAITDVNAILLLCISLLVFLRYGSFLELKSMYDAIQNRMLHLIFNKRLEAIETLLQSNIASRDAILDEIVATEAAIKANEQLINPIDENVVLTTLDSNSGI